MTDSTRPPLAIVGVSALFPGSTDATGFWRDILRGRDLLTEIPESHWLLEDYYDPDPKARDKTYARRGGFIDPIDFDAVTWGVPPAIIKATDTSQLLGLIVAERVLRDAAREQFAAMDRSKISVILGVTSAQELLAAMVSRLQRPVWVKALREQGLPESEVQAACDRISDHYVEWEESSFPGLLGNVVAGRIANRLDLGGTNCVTDAACASTFAALSMAAQELYLGDSDLVITGGVDTLNEIFMFMCFSKTPALSMSGDCRPFSDQADGTMLGEGLGMVALRRLEDAERDGDRIYAVIRGIGASSDGRSKSVYAPVSAGQASALARAYERAGYGAETVELVEGHGTGTKAGDAAELGGLSMVFGTEGRDERQWCALGSVKSQIGHTKAAAGAAGLFKAVMALHHRVLPPTIKVDRPNPALGLEDSAFYINTEARPWIRGSDHPRRASVSAFGFGGSNFHVALEEYCDADSDSDSAGGGRRAERLRSWTSELVVLGGGDVAAQARQWAERSEGAGSLEFAAYTTQQSYDHSAPRRLAVVATTPEELRARLTRAADRIDAAPDAAFELPDGTRYGVGAASGKVALLFPGQGSQYVGMGADLAMALDVVQGAWDRQADSPLAEGTRLGSLVFPIPRFADAEREADAERLRQTQWAQPAIGCTSVSMLGLVRALGIEPAAVAGHSFGEITALHAAGVLSERDLLRVAHRRGELMAAAGEDGAMIAVTASAEVADEVVREVEGVVLANHNAPNQVVLSGPKDAIAAAETALAARKLRATRLPVSTAFHSPVVAPSAEPFAEFLGTVEFSAAKLPVYSGEVAAPYEEDAAAQRARLGAQIARPVRFVDTVQAMADAGAQTFVEVGPGSVLSGLVGRILKGQPHTAVALDRRGRGGLDSLLQALAQLVAAGVSMDLSALWAGYRAPEDPAARSKPKLAIPISGTNYGKLYPPKGGAAALPPPNPPRAPAAQAVAGRVAAAAPPIQQAPVGQAAAGQEPALAGQTGHAPVGAVSRASTGGFQGVQSPSAPLAQHRPPGLQAPVSQGGAAALGSAGPLPEGWLAAWQQAQQQTAQTHALFQQSMAESHAAYLQAAQSSLMGLAALAGAPSGLQGVTPQPMIQRPVMQQSVIQQPVMQEPVVQQPMMQQPAMQQSVMQESAIQQRAIAQQVAPVAHRVAPADPAPPASASGGPAGTRTSAPPVAAAPAVDLQALMLEVVAEKTGYPVEMLELPMDMEAELGIDSIKRVEILAAVQERAPGMPEVDASLMGTLKTLGEIVDYMSGLLASVAPALSQGATEAPVAAAAAQAMPSVDLQGLMLEVVAEKTGYPAEMLEMSMDMEAELGIDSIKRVEILAAVQERAPGMPEVDASLMGTLKTLGEIVEYMRGLMGSVAPVALAAPAAGVAQAMPSVDLQGLMLEVVAEKTGYPAEMLEMSMDMEAELGIDSIKRVEILAAVQERAPGMPEVDASLMGTLKTLGEIVEYMRGLMGSVAPVALAAPAAGVAQAMPSVDLQGLMLEVVAEKTGYPAEMLEMSMDMEAELGIDSIKRVEILAAVQERAPGMPEVDASLMGTLKTLGEIVEYMRGLMGGASAAAGASVPVVDGAGAAAAAGEAPRLGRFALELVAAPATGLAQPGLVGGGAVYVTDDGGAVAAALVDELRLRGADAKLARSVPADASAVIFLGGLRPVADEAGAIAINREAFALCKQVAARFADRGGLLVTVQDTGGGFGLIPSPAPVRAYVGGVPALLKTARQEWPAADLKSIDIACGDRSPTAVAEAIAGELFGGGGEIEVALSATGERMSLRSYASEVVFTGEIAPLGEGDVVVVSGGARGVTAACVCAWAQECGARFVLLGRTPQVAEPAAVAGIEGDAALKQALLADAKARGERLTPASLSRKVAGILSGREIRRTLATLGGAGVETRYLAVDVTDAAAVAASLAEIRALWGPITGLVHGAGVLADKPIGVLDEAGFDRVFDTKVGGLRALLQATADDPIRVLGLFSSVSARCGNNGQSAYAMANEVLNKVAQAEARRRGGGVLVKSFGWGPWEGGMVNPALRQRFAELGVPMIPLEVGAKMLADELRGASPAQVELVFGGEPRPEALLVKGSEARTLELEVHVDRHSHAYLADHSIGGVAVVPVVLAMEWMGRLASTFRPDLRLASLDHVRVLRGIKLGGFDGEGDRFVIRCRPLSDTGGVRLSLEVVGHDGTPHYRAEASMEDLLSIAQAEADERPQPALGAWGGASLYGDVLFHGRSFQVIESLDGIGHEGIAGTLRGVSGAGWTWERWQTDAAALDGGLQLAVLWAREELGRGMLPMGVESLRLFKLPGLTGSLRCTARCREVGGSRVLADLWFRDESGDVVSELRGAELVTRPDMTSIPAT